MAKEEQSWKDKLGAAFGTEYNPEIHDPESVRGELAEDEVDNESSNENANTNQTLYVRIETKGRKNNPVTTVNEFEGSEDNLKNLAKTLKTKCGVGGSTKDGTIIIQGRVLEKVAKILKELGYGVKGV